MAKQELLRAERAMKRRENLMTADIPASMAGKPTVTIDMQYAKSQLKELADTLDDPNCLLSPSENKEIHEWLLRISNAAEGAKQMYNYRAETTAPRVPPPKAKSTIAGLGTQVLDNSEYLEYLDTLREEIERMREEPLK